MVRKVMFICAHNQTRSVAGEGLLTGERGFEVRSRAAWRGTKRKVTEADGKWADEVYVMMPGMIPVMVEAGIPRRKVHALWIPDKYYTCEPAMLREIKRQLEAYDIHVKKSIEKAQEDCFKVTERKMGYRGDEFLWTWYPETQEEVIGLNRQECPTGESTGSEYPYVPMWHIKEGERRTAERTHDEMLKEFAEAEAYCKQEEEKRGARPERLAPEEELRTEEAKDLREWMREERAMREREPKRKSRKQEIIESLKEVAKLFE